MKRGDEPQRTQINLFKNPVNSAGYYSKRFFLK